MGKKLSAGLAGGQGYTDQHKVDNHGVYIKDLVNGLGDVHSLLIVDRKPEVHHFQNIIYISTTGICLVEKHLQISYFFEFESGVLYQNKVPVNHQHLLPFAMKLLNLSKLIKTYEVCVFEGIPMAVPKFEDVNEVKSFAKSEVKANDLKNIFAGRQFQNSSLMMTLNEQERLMLLVLARLNRLSYPLNPCLNYSLSADGFWNQKLPTLIQRFSCMLLRYGNPVEEASADTEKLSKILYSGKFTSIRDFLNSFSTLKDYAHLSTDPQKDYCWLQDRFVAYLQTQMNGDPIHQKLNYLMSTIETISMERMEVAGLVMAMVATTTYEEANQYDRIIQSKLKKLMYDFFIDSKRRDHLKEAWPAFVSVIEVFEREFEGLTSAQWMANHHCVNEKLMLAGLASLEIIV